MEREAVPRLFEACAIAKLYFFVLKYILEANLYKPLQDFNLSWNRTRQHLLHCQSRVLLLKSPPRKCIDPMPLYLQRAGTGCEPVFKLGQIENTNWHHCNETSPSLLVTTPELVPVTLRPSLFQATWAAGWARTLQVMCTCNGDGQI